MNKELESSAEIEDRLRRRYLDRLTIRVRKMRKHLIDREWNVLRTECAHLKESGQSFRLLQIANLAGSAVEAIPTGAVSKHKALPEARHAVETLISAIDVVLSEK
jgi:hypothetical protein